MIYRMAWLRDLTARGRLRVRGEDRVRFLHSMTTNDIEGLAVGAGCRAAMLTVKGKTLGDLVIYRYADHVWLEMEPELRHKLFQVLDKHVVMDDVEIDDLTDATGELGIYGEDAATVLATALGEAVDENLPPWSHIRYQDLEVARAPDLAMPGFHVFGSRERIQSLAVTLVADKLDEAAWEVLRIEAGRPRYGLDVDEDRLILEAHLDDAIHLDKGCYLGQEVVARATTRGHINRQLVGLFLDGDGGVAAKSRLSGPGRDEAGLVTSSGTSPRLGAIALGYVHRTLWEPGTVLEVHAEGGSRRATVTTLPFPSARP